MLLAGLVEFQDSACTTLPGPTCGVAWADQLLALNHMLQKQNTHTSPKRCMLVHLQCPTIGGITWGMGCG